MYVQKKKRDNRRKAKHKGWRVNSRYKKALMIVNKRKLYTKKKDEKKTEDNLLIYSVTKTNRTVTNTFEKGKKTKKKETKNMNAH